MCCDEHTREKNVINVPCMVALKIAFSLFGADRGEMDREIGLQLNS